MASLEIKDVEIVLNGLNATQLPHANLLPGSLRLAALLVDQPLGAVSITLNGETWSDLGTMNLLPGSVAIPTDRELASFYVENADYAVDHDSGQLKRVAGSSIADGETVQAWFLPLTIFTEDTDYEVDTVRGLVKRITGTTLPDPARVLVNYTINGVTLADSLIEQAIIEAEDKIASRLRDEYSTESTDTGLITGATELVLSQVCDDLALQLLAVSGDNTADNRSRRYQELAQRYENRALATLARFLSQPIRSEGRKRSNPPAATGF